MAGEGLGTSRVRSSGLFDCGFVRTRAVLAFASCCVALLLTFSIPSIIFKLLLFYPFSPPLLSLHLLCVF